MRKDNRLIALSEEDKRQGRFVRIDALELPDQLAVCVWLKGYVNVVLIVRQVFQIRTAVWACNIS